MKRNSLYSDWDTGRKVRASNTGRRKRFFPPADRPDRSWGPSSLLFNGTGFFLGRKCGRGVNLTTHFHPVPRLQRSRQTHFLLFPLSIRGVDRDNILPLGTAQFSRLQARSYPKSFCHMISFREKRKQYELLQCNPVRCQDCEQETSDR